MTGDQVTQAYNRQSQRTSLADQNGSVHTFDYDLLGRPTEDRVTTLGTNVDGAVRRIETAYEVRGLVSRSTSFDSAAVGAGSVVNETKFEHNSFGQSVNTYQSHSGAVNVLSTPSVQTGYADGSSNTVRPATLTYPNGRVLTYDYGVSTSIANQASRIASLIDSDPASTHLADYSYLGLSRVVGQDSPQADLEFTLIGPTGSNDPDTGDIYAGLDRFGRIKDVRWRYTSADTDLCRVQYGYDRASNRTWRLNPSDPNEHFDWLLGYDGLHRLKDGERGTLDSTRSSIMSPQFAQCWSLDETGNWGGFRESDDGVNWSLVQARTANVVNELTAITTKTGTSWAAPSYDANGNMSSIPQPNAPASSYSATYDAWNRLVALVDSGTGETVQQNQYDGRGYRIATNGYTSGILTDVRHVYFTDQWQGIEERLGTSTSPDRHYVWGVQYIDTLVMRDRSISGGTLNERLYSSQDANWNVTAVVDETGAVQERYEYDIYGIPEALAPDFTVRGSSTLSWDVMYSGYRLESVSGCFLARFRMYHPTLGTWLTADPIGIADSANRYEYCKSQAPLFRDPSGLASWVWPWDANASWSPRNTLNLWTGGYVLDAADAQAEWDALDAQMEEDLETGPIVVCATPNFDLLYNASANRWRDAGYEDEVQQFEIFMFGPMFDPEQYDEDGTYIGPKYGIVPIQVGVLGPRGGLRPQFHQDLLAERIKQTIVRREKLSRLKNAQNLEGQGKRFLGRKLGKKGKSGPRPKIECGKNRERNIGIDEEHSRVPKGTGGQGPKNRRRLGRRNKGNKGGKGPNNQ